jgi:hypothetical protein
VPYLEAIEQSIRETVVSSEISPYNAAGSRNNTGMVHIANSRLEGQGGGNIGLFSTSEVMLTRT